MNEKDRDQLVLSGITEAARHACGNNPAHAKAVERFLRTDNIGLCKSTRYSLLNKTPHRLAALARAVFSVIHMSPPEETEENQPQHVWNPDFLGNNPRLLRHSYRGFLGNSTTLHTKRKPTILCILTFTY